MTTKREPKREPRGYVLPGSASVGLGTLGHRRTGFRGSKRPFNRRFRPSPPTQIPSISEGKMSFQGRKSPLINTRFNTTNRIRAYRRNPGLNRSHHSNSLSFKLLEAL